MLASSEMDVLNKMMLYAVYPMALYSAVYCTLLGFGVIYSGPVDKKEEEAQAKRLRMLRWLGPPLIVLMVIFIIAGVIGWL